MVEKLSTLTLFQRMGKTGNKKICDCGCGEEIAEYFHVKPDGIKNIWWCKCNKQTEKEREEEIRQIEEENKKQRIENLMKKSRLGKRFYDSTFANFKVTKDNKQVFERMKEYAKTFGSESDSILLHSHPGTGKTDITACVVNEIIKNRHTAIFVVVPALLAQIRETYNKKNKDEETEERIMAGLLECELLVLDDLGAESHRGEDDWASEKLFSIINHRYLDYKPILFTSNLSPNDLHDKLSARTFSRICEMTNRSFVDMDSIKDIRIYGIQAENAS